MKPAMILTGIILGTVFLTFPIPAAAEVIPADVQKVSTEGDSIRVVRQDNRKEIEIWLSVETRFEGLSSLHELVEGDEIIADTQKNPSNGRWEADALTVSKMVIRNPKSDVETMSETPEIPASVASMENEGRARTRNELRQTLEGLDRKMDELKKSTAKGAQLQEKYDMLTKDLAPTRQAAAEKLAALQISSAVTWDQDKVAADKAIEDLTAVMNNLERELTLEHPPAHIAE